MSWRYTNRQKENDTRKNLGMCSIRRIRVRLDIYSNIRFAYSFCMLVLFLFLSFSQLLWMWLNLLVTEFEFNSFDGSIPVSSVSTISFFSGCFGLMVPKHHRIKSSLHAEKRYLTNCSKTNHFAFAQCQYNVLFDSVTEVFSPVSLFVRFIHMCRNGDDVWVGAKPRKTLTLSISHAAGCMRSLYLTSFKNKYTI